MKRPLLKRLLTVALGLLLSSIYFPCLSAQENNPDLGDTIDMLTGELKNVPVHELTRVSVSNPEVADISDAQADKVSLIAKKAGSTVLFLWDADGERNIKVRITDEDLSVIKARVQKIVEEANIKGVKVDENRDIGKVVLSGETSKDQKYRLTDILQPYQDSLLILVNEEKSEDLIQVDMEIVEISTSLEKNLGILWGSSGSATGTGGTSSSGSSSSSSSSSGSSSTNSNSGAIGLNYNEKLPSGHKFQDLFKIGSFQRNTSLVATVNALLSEGKARLISKPRLVAESGKKASFLVGGEIPVESTTVSTTGSTLTSNTTYAQYGVSLSVTPTIRQGKIELELNVDIRDIDGSNSSNGNVAFITRTATTDLYMENKQTIALAGLIKYTDSKTTTSIPFLGKIPLLGLLFRDTVEPDTNTEMVIILTPTVLTDKKFADKQLVMPTPDEISGYKEIDAKYRHESIKSAWPPAKPLTAAEGQSQNVLPAMAAYARTVQEKISQSISFPPQMPGGMQLTGTVKLKLHILKDGSLDSEEVTESSGNSILDRDAMLAARTAAPFDAFSIGMDQQDMVFMVPIVFNKMISQGQSTAQKIIASY